MKIVETGIKIFILAIGVIAVYNVFKLEKEDKKRKDNYDWYREDRPWDRK